IKYIATLTESRARLTTTRLVMQSETARHLSEEKRSEFGQIAPPNHPRVGSGRLNLRHLHSFGFQPGAQITVGGNEPVFRSARYQQQPKLLVHLGVETGKV